MGKFLFFLVVFFFLSGAIVSYEEYTQSLSLDNLMVRSEDPIAEAFFWKNITPQGLRFWPVFLFQANDLKRKIETESPMSFFLKRKGINGFDVELVPLKPWLVLKWRGKEFYLTRDGKIWDSGHPLNEMISGITRPKTPPFVFSEGLPSPSNDLPDGQVVTNTILPMEIFAKWTEGFETSGWKSQIREIGVSRREGRYLLSLSLRIRNRTVKILLRGDQSRWKELSSAVSQILQQLQFTGEDIIIDTTYTDRIIVRNVAGGGQEGSGR